MDIAILADQDACTGFQLAGVSHTMVYDETKAKEQIAKLHDAKIIVLTEPVGASLRSLELMEKITAVTIEIPSKSGSTGAALEQLGKLFESAIGVKLKGDHE